MIAVFMAFQGTTVLIALPVIRWLFGEVLSSAGLHGFDMNTFGAIFEVPLSVTLLVMLVVLALFVMSLQLAVMLLACAQLKTDGVVSLHGLGTDVLHLLGKLANPRSVVLLVYLFGVLPLSQFGFLSALSNSIAVPDFISGELMKSASGAVGYGIVMVFIGVVNVRLALVLPVFALTDASGMAAFRVSWRITRHAFWPIVAAMTVLFAAINIVGLTLIFGGSLPTVLSDSLSPQSSPVIAAAGLGFAEVAVLLLVGLTVAALCAMLLELLRRGIVLAPTVVLARTDAGERSDAQRAQDVVVLRRRRLSVGGFLVGAVAVCAVAVLTTVNMPVMEAMSTKPTTLVLGHRGFNDGGVENTIPALEAAGQAGADLVEIDVMETKDGQFVVMHDANLQRLANKDVKVANLSLAQITALEVNDALGHSALIPSLHDYLLRAKELAIPLLVEIKLHGGEAPNLVPRLVAEMKSLDAFDSNIFHSLDKPSIEELKRLEPSAYAGYIMPFAGVEIPQTDADFLVIEEWSYTAELRDDAWKKGKEIFVWTVNSQDGQRQKLRDNVDGIITDHPDTAVAARAQMENEEGLFDKLQDAIARFVTVI
ncbi:glycerophosphodiester phosphodiesterase [Arthrobacter cryoconiti]